MLLPGPDLILDVKIIVALVAVLDPFSLVLNLDPLGIQLMRIPPQLFVPKVIVEGFCWLKMNAVEHSLGDS